MTTDVICFINTSLTAGEHDLGSGFHDRQISNIILPEVQKIAQHSTQVDQIIHSNTGN